jgi:carbonic anhydrase
MDQNMCGTGDEQSPIDIRLSGVACVEHHQIRTRVSQTTVSQM